MNYVSQWFGELDQPNIGHYDSYEREQNILRIFMIFE